MIKPWLNNDFKRINNENNSESNNQFVCYKKIATGYLDIWSNIQWKSIWSVRELAIIDDIWSESKYILS